VPSVAIIDVYVRSFLCILLSFFVSLSTFSERKITKRLCLEGRKRACMLRNLNYNHNHNLNAAKVSFAFVF